MYTRKGDDGTTSLFGSERVRKDAERVEAYGTVDELNAVLGVAISETNDGEIVEQLTEVQRMLFVAGGDLAAQGASDRVPRMGPGEVQRIEKMTDSLLESLPPIRSFILPGGTNVAASLHLARAVCRRAERRIVALSKNEEINKELLPFFNRLSSYLFNLARHANRRAGRNEIAWSAKG